jgi:hypothetical protein
MVEVSAVYLGILRGSSPEEATNSSSGYRLGGTTNTTARDSEGWYADNSRVGIATSPYLRWLQL